MTQTHKSQKTGAIPSVEERLPDGEAMEKIAPFARRKLTPEEVFVFPVILCDNEIDRDGERFTEDCLDDLVPLMKGRTGICDHDPKAENQLARLYDCRVEKVDREINSLGQPLRRLVGSAYMLRTPQNAERIAAIEGGICKEVSISCAVSRQTCSVCGRDARTCTHLKGRMYGDKRCFVELSDPTDGYEWSFVAIPAQRNAGVTKAGKAVNHLEENMTLFKTISEGRLTECPSEVMLTDQEALELSDKVAKLSALADMGKKYEAGLRDETLRLSKLAGVDLPEEMTARICGKLDGEELSSLKKLFASLCAKKFPMRPQTATETPVVPEETLDSYRI